MSLKDQLFARKSLQVLLDEMAGDHRLKRALGPITLTALGIGAVIGAGIFVATGAAAKDVAGPALMLSYVVAGVTCIFAALCYAEFASMAPVAGSAYTYAYTTLGELFAWIIGWDLVLEYAVGAATVANGWSGYFQSVLLKAGIAVPMVVSGAPHKYDQGHLLPNVVADYPIKVVQKELDDDKPARADGKEEPAKGKFWVFTIGEERDGQEVTKDVVVGPVGDADTEAKIKDGAFPMKATQKVVETKTKPGTWADGSLKPANGVFWVFSFRQQRDAKTVVLGPVGDTGVEAQLHNPERAYFNLPAILVVFLVTAVLVKGISESAGANAVMVGIKVAAVLFVIVVGAFLINQANWTRNFAPYGWTGISFFGLPVAGETNKEGDPVGVLAGAAIIFFAYIGFDSVSTHAEEAKNPRRDVPIGIIASLVVCTILYIAVVAVLTGMVDYRQLSKDAGVSDAFKDAGLGWAQVIIALAGVAGITSVLLVMMLSAPRVFLAMARDGLVPRAFFADVHPKFRTPWKSTIAIGIFVALMTALLPIDALLHLTNIGTLFAFVIVCAAVLIMRRTNPEAPRPFRCPLVPLVPVLGILACLLLMLSLPAANWLRLFVWLAIGLCIYFLYGRHHSLLGMELRGELKTQGVSGAGMLKDTTTGV
ncbi:MAG TPA: amino acid permease [Gemmataceae bacterium]|nr:amino acid permease [Gemmataceae bacterium]